MSRARALAAASAIAIASGVGLLVPPPASAGIPPDLIASTGNALITFNSTAPAGTAVTVPITLPAGANTLAGIDVRPATQVLYGVFSMQDGSITVAPINPTTGAVGTLVTLTLNGSTLDPLNQITATDFNPVADRLRLIANGDESYAANVDTGVTVQNADLNGIAGPQQGHHASGAAYTNSTPGPAPASTTLFDILDLSQNNGTDSLVTQDPTTGVVTLVGPLGRSISPIVGFEITAGGAGFMVATERSANPPLHARTKAGLPEFTSLYTVNLTTGATTVVGLLGNGQTGVNGLTSFPVQVPQTTTTTLATTTTAAVSPTSAVSPTTRVLARTGEEETRQSALGMLLIAAGGVAIVAAARLRTRRDSS